jgi:hypothetical protein
LFDLQFEYFLGEMTVCEIVRDCCNSIWNGLITTEMPEKTKHDWMNITNEFYQRMQFPNCMGNTFE